MAFVVATFAFFTALFATTFAGWALAIALLEIPLLAILWWALAAFALAWRTSLRRNFPIRRRRDDWRKWNRRNGDRRARLHRLTANHWTTAGNPPEAPRLVLRNRTLRLGRRDLSSDFFRPRRAFHWRGDRLGFGSCGEGQFWGGRGCGLAGDFLRGYFFHCDFSSSRLLRGWRFLGRSRLCGHFFCRPFAGGWWITGSGCWSLRNSLLVVVIAHPKSVKW